MQELVSFISIMLGVVILTAWVMWILLRSSGDSKTQQFASESARDGQTLAVMENNELKNKVTQLERELKVLMSAGYPGKDEGKDNEKLKAKSLKLKERNSAGALPVGSTSGGENSAKDKELKSRHEVKPSEELKAKWKRAEERNELQVERKEEGGKGKGERGKVKGERLKVKDDVRRSAVPGAMSSDERSKVKDEGLRIKKEKTRGKVKGERLKVKDDVRRSAVPGAMSLDERSKVKDEGLRIQDERTGGKGKGERLKVKGEGLKGKEKKPVVEKVPAEAVVQKPAETIRSSEVAPLSDAQRITDEDEKKKIADYLASVAETTERQMKEVEALEEKDEVLKEASRYPDEDLKKIKGVGLHLEGRLKKAGISSYQQIAEFTDEDIQRVAREIGYFPRRIKRDEWVEQAQALVKQLKVKS